MLIYQKHPQVKVENRERPLLATPQGGKIALDSRLLALWEYAHGKTFSEVLAGFPPEGSCPEAVRAGLACLAEAGLLSRDVEGQERPLLSRSGPLVSAVIVAYNSRAWLEACLPSLADQTYTPLEVMVVDNGSADDTATWLVEEYPDVRLVRSDRPGSLARAINRGVAAAQGEFFLLLNPDVRLERDAVAQMVAVAAAQPDCGAVAAKLKFSWAPAFLNGLGNQVGAFYWGMDNGLGHLDFGQFDGWREVPSACFAAALVPRRAWERVGPLDEGFPLYYEDSEWSYRARLNGLKICAAPQAVIYHAFSARLPSGAESGLAPRKLRQVAYGRLRWATRLLGRRTLFRFLRNYLAEDLVRSLLALARGRWSILGAYRGAWSDYLRALPSLRAERRDIQSRRAVSDRQLFQMQKELPMPLIWHGLPQLTWDLIQHHYLPLFLAGRTREVPEFSASSGDRPEDLSDMSREQGWLRRLRGIWAVEGFPGLLHQLGRTIQWNLIRP